MNSDNPWKHVLAAFLIAVAIYVATYSFIEHRRVRNGPWQVTFASEASSHSPCLLINQPGLGLTNIEIVFPHEPLPPDNLPVTFSYDQPRQVPFPVPFGNCVFMDATFLPGTLTLRLFGHEIEFLPRTMIIDHTEQPWRRNQTITLWPSINTNGAALR
jgi:hypothetical protein